MTVGPRSFAALVLLALAACASSTMEDSGVGGCRHASDCGAGTTCVGGRCVASMACTSSRMCPDLVCDAARGICVECVVDGDCPAAGGRQACRVGVCEPSIACDGDRACSAMAEVCDLTRMVCVECVADRDCLAPLQCAADHVCRTGVPDAGLDAAIVDAGSDAGHDAGDAGHDAGDAGHDAGDAGHDAGPPPALYHGWVSPIAGCLTTSHDAELPTILGGTYPYNTGDTDACRAWKLAATVCTTEPTLYSDATNWTCPASGGFTDPVFGTFCMSPSTQYACSTCPGACNAMCLYRPLSLRNCSGTEAAQM
jgi:hypothetical protein